MANGRFQMLVVGTAFALMVGWVLHIGQQVLVPIAFSVLVTYVVVGIAHVLKRIPVLGPRLPGKLRIATSVLVIAAVLAAAAWLIVSNFTTLMQLAPELQDSLLEKIQRAAAYVGMDAAPTWATLREGLFERVSVPELLATVVGSATGIAAGLVIVVLYVTFLMIERRVLPNKIDNLSSQPRDVARIRQVIDSINTRIGQYLALKSLINVLLGFVSWLVLVTMGVELAAFWAVLIGLLNYVPYVGSLLGVLFPVAMALVQFDDLGSVLMLLVALTAVQFLIGNFLDPYLMGNSLNLSPFVILVALAVWATLWGVAGAFLAVPITAALAIVLSEFSGTRPVAVLLSRSGSIEDVRPRRRRPARR